MANSRVLLIETGAAVYCHADSPAAHANDILIGIVTFADNHSSFLDGLFAAESICLEYSNNVAQGKL